MSEGEELGPSQPPSDLAASAAPSASPPEVPASPEPAPGPSPEAGATPEGGTPAGTEPETPAEPTAWAGLASRDEVLELPEFQEHTREREEAAMEKGRSETHSRMQPFLQRQADHYKGVEEGITALNTALKRLQREDQLQPQQLADLIEDHQPTFDALRGIDAERGKWGGVRGLLAQLAQAAKSPEIAAQFDSRIMEYSHSDAKYGDPDPRLWGDIQKALSAAAVKPVQEKLEALTAKVTRLEAENAALKRNGQPAPVAVTPSAGGGTKPYSEEVGNLTPAEIDARTQAFAAGQES